MNPKFLTLTSSEENAVARLQSIYPLRISDFYANLINWNDSDDPLRRQVIPTTDELTIRNDESVDPVRDHRHELVPGLIHKYQGRVLWLVTDQCPLHCRFCFRRCSLQSSAEATLDPLNQRIDEVISTIAARQDLHEVILSGGDPLMESPEALQIIIRSLEKIKHIKLLRIHSRCLVADPERMTSLGFLSSSSSLMLRLVMHINHPRELTKAAIGHVHDLLKRQVPVLSQSVLLRGVNDDPNTLRELFLSLVIAGIQPYYLHHLDYAPGTSHFRVLENEGLRFITKLRDSLPGYAIPRFVRDIPGRGSKTFL